ncbi:MAG: FAD-dependent oxidoreductase [Parcubacteria group bacterium]|nr:FAD-dependent oxidoreductase [Parcubacteria group bacterium]
MYDLVIVGGGPAATAAAVYAGRKKLKTLLIAESFGGQSIVSADVQNWIGDMSVSGVELAGRFEKHIRAQESVEIKSPESARQISKKENGFSVTTDKEAYQARAVILASGARRRRLNIPGEAELEGKGVAYCSTCDAPLFGGKNVAVVGGGNAGLEAVVDLLPYATEIYLLEFSGSLKGDAITQEKIRAKKNVHIILNAKAERIEGDGMFVKTLFYTDLISGKEEPLGVEGVFVEIGSVPNSEMVRDLVELNKHGEVVIDHKTAATSREGIWAAGDVTDEPFKQNNISAGDAVKAALSAYQYLLARE